MRELSAKGGRLHSPGRSRPLHQGVQRGSADTQHQRDAEHTLIAYESDLEARQIVGRSDQGNEAVGREVDVADTFAGLAVHLLKAKLNVLATREQMSAILVGEGGQQTIWRPEPQRSWHATLLSCGPVFGPGITACPPAEQIAVRCTTDGRSVWHAT